MQTEVRSSRGSQIVACAVACLFVLGFIYVPIGEWTGPMLAAWFVGTQKPRRGFLWMVAFSFVPRLVFGWRALPLVGPEAALRFVALLLAAVVVGVLPFTFHRLVSPRLPGWLATLPLPLAGVGLAPLVAELGKVAPVANGVVSFIILWFAATVIWLWNRESRATMAVFDLACAAAIAVEYAKANDAELLSEIAIWCGAFWQVCLGGALLLAIWALFRPIRGTLWAERPETVAMLRSPFSAEALRLEAESGIEALVSNSGERFPVRKGIPAFLKPEDLAGDNGKYNKLYETIGGFYDDTQRVVGALRGLDLDSYFENYMSLLEVKAGDRVLETSVGTGLNFKYLPEGVKLAGVDLSAEMLARCAGNMRRWGMEADLYLGNAESLPFADGSFDVVYTCGGFNFFSDKAKAVREMIRVAKPGGRLMIEDETEEYVKSTYEKIPYTSGFYSTRDQAVTVPVDLVPAEMEEVKVEMLKEGKFYAITFRKPIAVGPTTFGTECLDVVRG